MRKLVVFAALVIGWTFQFDVASAQADCPAGQTRVYDANGNNPDCVATPGSGSASGTMHYDAQDIEHCRMQGKGVTTDANGLTACAGTASCTGGKVMVEGQCIHTAESCKGPNLHWSDDEQSCGNMGSGKPQSAEADADPDPCATAHTRAKYACDPIAAATTIDSNSSAMLEQAMQSMVGMASAVGSAGKSQNEVCGAAADLAKTMGIIQGTRAVACKTLQTGCMNTCKARAEQMAAVNNDAEYEKARAKHRQCNNYEESFARQLAQAMNYANSYVGSAICQKVTAQNAPPAGGPVAVDCKDPAQRAANPACVCERNPRHPSCGGSGFGTGGGFAGGGGSGAGGLGSADGGGSMPSYGDPDAAGGLGPKGSGNKGAGGGGPGGGGGGGTGPSLLGGGGRGGGDGSGGLASSGYNTGVITGQSGGSFGGYGKNGASSNNGSGGGRMSSLMAKLKDKFNIKDALPTRGLAGMSKAAAEDGITGAMGETIWQKATRQYKNQERQGQFFRPSMK